MRFAKKTIDKENSGYFFMNLIQPMLNRSEEVSNRICSFPFPNSEVFQKTLKEMEECFKKIQLYAGFYDVNY